MLKPQPPQQPSQPQQPPPTQQAVARRPPGGTSPPNGGLPGPLATSAAPPGPPAAASPCLGPVAAAGSGLRRGAEGILAPQPPPPQQHQERPGAAAIGSARGQSTGKGPPQSPVFEGVYNNSRMLHFLTAVVGSTCDVKVKNGTTYEGIFKTLSSKFELAVDAVHRKASEPAGGPRREDIVDTMVFKPSDVMLVHFRNVDFNYATKDKFTDSAIAMNSKVNGEHKEKVLQRWEGGDSNSDDYDLESDMSNGWDPNEMFKFNEENYGVKTTYDSSLSSYTVPLEKDNSEEFRQRELRAAQLAREIESSPQYRLRIAMENDDGRTEEEKHSAVQRQGSGRESPSLASREGKYIPLPQRVREGPRGGVRCSSSRGGRPGLSSLPPRGPHHLDNSSPGPGSEARGINGGPSRMSPKAQRPLRGAKTLSSPSNRPSGETSVPPPPAAPPFLPVGRMYPPRSPKSAAPAPISASCPEPPIGSAVPTSSASIPVTSSVSDPGVGSISPASPKISLAPTDVKELSTKESGRTLEPQELARIAGKVPGLQNEQKRFQLEELRKFGAQFKLQPSSSPENSLDPFPPRILKEEPKGKEKEVDGLLTSEPMGSPVSSKTESVSDKEDKPPLAPSGGTEGPEQPPPPCPSQTGSPPVGLIKGEDKDEGPVAEQVKKSTLNPNAKEFNPTKPLLSVNKSTSTPTSPGPRTHSTPSIPVLTAGQSGLYSPQYISYIPQIHMGPAVQAPQMYPYPVSNSVPGQQGKYRGAKGSLPPQRSDQHQPASAPPMMQAAAAAGPPLVAATPYSSYIPYNPQQFPGQPAMMQPMAHYPSQPVFAPMLQSNPRMLTSGSHPQAIVSSSTPQYPSAEQPTPQALYATVHQSYPHHATQLHAHQPQPATTPTGSQPQSQHAAPSPVQHQAGQAPHLGSGQPQQNLYHPGALTGTPPSLPPGPSAQSPQSSFPQPAAVYAIHHQQLPHGFTNMAHVTQAHVQTGITAAPPPHPGAPHPPQVMLLHPPQSHGGPPQGAVPQSGVPALSASTPSPYPYIGHPQGEQPGQAPGFPGGADDRIPLSDPDCLLT
ncbi:ataxin-2-like protein isoform X12 [Gorilla gorilla gorilla]|uniref:ataxin-2-like protein isoform X12 n=1 Tax=Gorilla gorilla gorilla TaxID=9595 RepID=UPI00123E7B62|nr:ataxin-2-like protein isoform X11 [Gorilla gorilla gorilla]XP_030858950.1 ataxin-2-like protein isoform X11 [Gorilla gorilla gorilla]XP_030858951.1 ataxin-2-like protein isoform X11 [Gorilla gorilla gorilla]XP_055221656.1 ataxin-2-like protein isoform X11 [Gorilla gorilla gorilla]XP_055221658.1 ataxin-2-like protein isoform X11 [Gorilla gorilla gorilla]XP_055221659.1 ataxin-2-like protein isoform X11 [Gorilla gorilla gorilla]